MTPAAIATLRAEIEALIVGGPFNEDYDEAVKLCLRVIDRWAAAQPSNDSAAWAEAEAAIPDEDDWSAPCVYGIGTTRLPEGYGAKVSPPGDTGRDTIYVYAYPTPAAALRALVEKLRERP